MALSDHDPGGTTASAEVRAEAVLAEVTAMRAGLTAAQEAASTWLPGLLAAAARVADLAPSLGADLAVAVSRLERDQAGFAARLDELTARLDSLDGRVATVAAQASSDPLTGVLNRAAFEAALEQAVRAAAADGLPLSLLFCDVDDFKQFNDSFGHHVGDHVLRLVAKALDRFPGGRHLVGRLGGEEFALAAPERTADQVLRAARRVAAALARRTLRMRGTGEALRAVTLSAGVAELRPGEDAASLLRRADAAMYRAKREGRNRVVRAV